MSSGLNCELCEVPGRGYYYILERSPASRNGWDWREDAQAYGPFGSADAANEHLAANHQNPGGQDQVGIIDPTVTPYAALLTAAHPPDQWRGSGR